MEINIEETEATNLLSNYLKLLYSPSFFHNDQAHLRETFVIKDDDLVAEQQARHRNLFNFLKMSNPPLFLVLEEFQLKTEVSEYCDSDNFWQFQGRTLLENFCLYIYNKPSYMNKVFIREVAKVSGIISGLFQAYRDNSIISPWKNRVQFFDTQSQKTVEESFESSIPIINASGIIEDINCNGLLYQPRFHIVIRVIDGKLTKIYSKEVGL